MRPPQRLGLVRGVSRSDSLDVGGRSYCGKSVSGQLRHRLVKEPPRVFNPETSESAV